MNAKPVSDPETFRKEIRNYIFNQVQDQKITNNIEKGIFNFSIRKAGKMKVVKKWDNEYFVLIYKQYKRCDSKMCTYKTFLCL